jgi:thiol-disulfide isomerase/thioredoxin
MKIPPCGFTLRRESQSSHKASGGFVILFGGLVRRQKMYCRECEIWWPEHDTCPKCDMEEIVIKPTEQELREAIEQFALSVNEQPEATAVRMPPKTWAKYRRMLEVAGIDENVGEFDNLADICRKSGGC